MTRAETLHDELSRIGDLVGAARELVADGQLINLAPLEQEVSRICGTIGNLTGAEAHGLKPVLLSLMDDLDRLAEEMRACQSRYESELRTLTSHGSAARAYSAAPQAAGTKARK